jgi:hypothetical protein
MKCLSLKLFTVVWLTVVTVTGQVTTNSLTLFSDNETGVTTIKVPNGGSVYQLTLPGSMPSLKKCVKITAGATSSWGSDWGNCAYTDEANHFIPDQTFTGKLLPNVANGSGIGTTALPIGPIFNQVITTKHLAVSPLSDLQPYAVFWDHIVDAAVGQQSNYSLRDHAGNVILYMNAQNPGGAASFFGRFRGDWLPQATDTYNLGGDTLRWKGLELGTGNILFGGHILPRVNLVSDIGGPASKIRHGYFNNVTIDGNCLGPGCTNLPVIDTTAIVKGSVDTSKLLRFEVDGFTTSTTRVLTPQNADYVLAGTNISNTFTVQQNFMDAIMPTVANGSRIGSQAVPIGPIWNQVINTRHLAVAPLSELTGLNIAWDHITDIAVGQQSNYSLRDHAGNVVLYMNAQNPGGAASYFGRYRGDWLPAASLSYNLGSEVLQWQGASFGTGNINFGGHLIPRVNITSDIGAAANKIRRIYVQDLTIDGSCTGCTQLPVADTQTVVKGSTDATKLLRFEVDGFTAGTTRALTPQNADYIIAGTNLSNTFTVQQNFGDAIMPTVANGSRIGSSSVPIGPIWNQVINTRHLLVADLSDLSPLTVGWDHVAGIVVGASSNYKIRDPAGNEVLYMNSQTAGGTPDYHGRYRGHWRPQADNIYQLGNNTARWLNLELGTGGLVTDGHIMPRNNLVTDIGSAGVKIRHGYFQNITIDGNCFGSGCGSAGSAPFTIDATGLLKYAFVGKSDSGWSTFVAEGYKNDSSIPAAGMLMQTARGGPLSKVRVEGGDRLGIVIAGGWNGSVYRNTAGFAFFVDNGFIPPGTPGFPEAMPTYTEFYVTPQGTTTRVPALRLGSDLKTIIYGGFSMPESMEITRPANNTNRKIFFNVPGNVNATWAAGVEPYLSVSAFAISYGSGGVSGKVLFHETGAIETTGDIITPTTMRTHTIRASNAYMVNSNVVVDNLRNGYFNAVVPSFDNSGSLGSDSLRWTNVYASAQFIISDGFCARAGMSLSVLALRNASCITQFQATQFGHVIIEGNYTSNNGTFKIVNTGTCTIWFRGGVEISGGTCAGS